MAQCEKCGNEIAFCICPKGTENEKGGVDSQGVSSWDRAEKNLSVTLKPVVCESILRKISSEDNQRAYSEFVNKFGALLRSFNINNALVERLENQLNDGVYLNREIEYFNNSFQELSLTLNQIKGLTGVLNLDCAQIVFPSDNIQQHYTQNQLVSLQEYIQASSTEFSGAVAVYQPHLNVNPQNVEIASDQAHADKFYNIASVAKIFTGLLPLVLVKQGIIQENDLNKKGVKIPDEVINEFPESLREEIKAQLKNVTLHQLMTHRAGFGNYSQAYRQDMAAKISAGEAPPKYNDHNQLLRFSSGEEGKLSPPGNERYSNVGMVLLAAAVQQLYNDKLKEEDHIKTDGLPLDYNDIQQKDLFDRAGVQVHYRAPDDACYSEGDHITANFLASPAGCAWMKPSDLVKFGQYVTELYQDDEMKKLITDYGQEFFDPETETISHRGDLPGQPGANAHYSVSLRSGEVFAAVSDKPNLASNLYYFSMEQLGRENQDDQIMSEHPDVKSDLTPKLA